MDRNTEDYLEGLAGYSVVFTKVAPNTKRTTRTWDYFENLHEQRGSSRLDLVHDWLRQGYGVGFLLRNGLGAVDADDFTTVSRIIEFEDRDGYLCFPKVFTPGNGIHAHFEHPPDLDLTRVKNHLCHPKEEDVVVPWDFKLNTRTMLMAPGTAMEKGHYQAGIWMPPPVLDIRHLAPELEIFKTDKPFLIDQRPRLDRTMTAMSYLKHTAPVSIEGKGRRKALRLVAEHLVAFLDLDPSFAFYLMTTTKQGKDRKGNPVVHVAWNQRCLKADGSPAPWSDNDLWNALEDAVDAAPFHGALLLQAAQEKEFARWSAASFIGVLTHLPMPISSIWIKSDALYRVFLEFSGVNPDAFRKSELGLEVARAIDRGQLPFVEVDRIHADGRIYRGLDLNTLRMAMDAYENRHKAYFAAS